MREKLKMSKACKESEERLDQSGAGGIQMKVGYWIEDMKF